MKTYINYQERKIVIFEKGGELGNTELIFRKMDKVMEGMRDLMKTKENEEGTIWKELIINGMTDTTREKILEIIGGRK
ncbi:MAG: hypothetical protein ACFFDW_00680 [Candidatus Thorarchaeota archaeon]